MSKKTDIFQPELLDELLKNCNSPGDVIGQGGLFKQLQKALLERVMDAELTLDFSPPSLVPHFSNPKTLAYQST